MERWFRPRRLKKLLEKSGVTAWLIEDHKLPLLSMHFAFRGGVEQDQSDKQGLANLTMNLLTEGAGPYDAVAFQQQLADNSIAMSFAAGRDALMGSMKTLSVDKNKAFELLRLALTRPRFEKKAVERARSQQLSALRVQLGNPEWQVRYGLFSTNIRWAPLWRATSWIN
jgi:zinc protease